MRWQVAFAEACGNLAQTVAGFLPRSRSTSPVRSPHLSDLGCTGIPCPWAHLLAKTSSANKLLRALPGPEICPRSQSASSGAAATDPRPARYMARRSGCLLPSAGDYCPRCGTISLLASVIRPQSGLRSPLPLHTSCGYPHARREQTTTQRHSTMRALPRLGCG